jgi:hypothetical protein
VCVSQLKREVTQKIKAAKLVWIKTSWPEPGMVAGRRSAPQEAAVKVLTASPSAARGRGEVIECWPTR